MTEEIQVDAETTEIQFSEEQQQFIDKRIGQARIKAREKATADAAAVTSQAAQEAETTKLEADKNWEKLNTMQKARIAELEPLEAQVQAFTALIDTMLKDRIKVLGDAAKKAVEALPESLTAIDRLNWLNQNSSLFEEGPAPKAVGTPARKLKKQTVGKTPAELGHRHLKI